MDSLQDRARHEPFLTLEEERVLIARAQNGDRSAVERLVLSHLALAQGEARRLGLGPGLLDDALQDAAEAMVRAIDRFDPGRGTRFGTFARWAIKSALKKSRRFQEIPLDIDPPVAATPASPGVSDTALALLDEEERQIVALRFGLIDGHERSERETARILGLTRHRVRAREGEAMARLRRRLANVGLRAPQGADPL